RCDQGEISKHIQGVSSTPAAAQKHWQGVRAWPAKRAHGAFALWQLLPPTLATASPAREARQGSLPRLKRRLGGSPTPANGGGDGSEAQNHFGCHRCSPWRTHSGCSSQASPSSAATTNSPITSAPLTGAR